MKNERSLWPLLLAALLISASLAIPAVAQESEEPENTEEPEGRAPAVWNLDLALSVTHTTGNTESDSGSVGLSYKTEWGDWAFTADVNAIKVDTTSGPQSEKVTTTERYTADIAIDRKFSEHWSLSVIDAYYRDPFAGIDLRYALQVGARYQRQVSEKWSTEWLLGGGYEIEELIDGSDSEHSVARLDFNNEWKLKGDATFSQKLGATGNLDDTEDFRVVFHLGVTAPLTDLLALKLAYDMKYENQPVLSAEDLDTTLLASVVLTLKSKETEK